MRALSPLIIKPGCAPFRFLCGVVGCGGRRFRDSYDYAGLLRSCASLEGLKQIHAQVITAGCGGNPFLAAKLVSQYVEFDGSGMGAARSVFDCTHQRDAFLWNVMIRGYANLSLPEDALGVYCWMRWSGVAANRYTYPFAFKACGAIGERNNGWKVHGDALKSGLESDLFVANALVACYAKCGDVATARRVFDEIPERDLVSWNSMIAGYGQSEHAQEALLLLHELLRDDTAGKPEYVTLVGLLPACTKLAAVQAGMWIHSYVIKSGIEIDVVLGSGLVGIYASCGRLPIARDVFERIPVKNIVAWNAMIKGYGMHGHAPEALHLFSEMLSTGLHPDGICFLSVLSACSHAGLVDKGWEIFRLMGEYGVEKGEVHYGCMVDLLGRAGRLQEAVELISSISTKPGKAVWGALLGACRIHKNVELAEEVFERILVLDPENAGRYLALAKTYEDAGRGDDAAGLRMMMKERKVRKPLGCSSIEVDSMIHTFGVEDESHPMTEEIYNALEELGRMVEEVGVAAIG
uniref:Pentatricopeptide repeat-containing protein At5g66520 n=1 Tax=Anthurium amnicola TaxID=1678845 RepID=A0A1D1YF13_9ARAE